jgi:DHA2 family multidrug resistance protein-like MFS transporter
MSAALPGKAGTVAVLAAMAMVVLDAGVTNVALPTMAASLATTPERSILVVTAYQVALVMGLLPAAHLAERTGLRRLFMLGIGLFSGASLLCALAPSLPLLVAARFLQGLGGAAIMALGIALLRFALGTERLAAAIGWNALNVALCSAAAPSLGALILGVASWPWLFLVNLPVGLAAFVAARSLPRVAPTTAAVDLASMALYAGGAGLLVVAAEMSSVRHAWIGIAGTAAACFVLLIRRELPKQAPLVPLDLLRLHPFLLPVLASVCCFVGQSAGILGLSFYIQLGLDRDPLTAGLVTTCWPLAVAITSPFATGLARRASPAAVCVAGALVLAAGLLGVALVPVAASVAPLAACVLACGVGFGLFQVTNNRNLFLAAPAERSAVAGGMQGTARLAGQTAGAVAVTLLFVRFGAAAPRIALGLAAACALAAALVSSLRARACAGAGEPCAEPGRAIEGPRA